MGFGAYLRGAAGDGHGLRGFLAADGQGMGGAANKEVVQEVDDIGDVDLAIGCLTGGRRPVEEGDVSRLARGAIAAGEALGLADKEDPQDADGIADIEGAIAVAVAGNQTALRTRFFKLPREISKNYDPYWKRYSRWWRSPALGSRAPAPDGGRRNFFCHPGGRWRYDGWPGYGCS